MWSQANNLEPLPNHFNPQTKKMFEYQISWDFMNKLYFDGVFHLVIFIIVRSQHECFFSLMFIVLLCQSNHIRN